MGYHVVDPADVDPAPDRPSEMRYVSEAVGMENMGLRVYDVAPGEEIPVSGLHYHDRQEEVFYVVEGRLAVETPDRTYHAEAGQFLRRRAREPPPGAQRRGGRHDGPRRRGAGGQRRPRLRRLTASAGAADRSRGRRAPAGRSGAADTVKTVSVRREPQYA